jgi:hypothetical protein
MFEFLTNMLKSKTSVSAVASFLVAILGPRIGLDQTTALEIAGAIGTLAILFLRNGIIKAQVAAENSGVTPEIVNQISAAVIDAFPGRKVGAPE